ncbi:hypothetical protein K438DRAFT_1826769 [Mycena galopus ATCC 62051]|nr:hypothetical protein K438DRAFT_1826769 [Mycena galopus ATCC 62051]
MPEVIDLTLDSPPPKESADDDENDSRRKERQERKAEKRQKKRDSRRRHEPTREEPDPDSKHEGRRSHRSRDDKDRDGDDRKRRRESFRERDSDRKRSRRERERDPPIPDENLFFIDATPAELPAAARYATTTTTVEELPALILPPHVSVFGETPAAILPTEPLDSDEEDYIEYLDYDNRKDCPNRRADRWAMNGCERCNSSAHQTPSECPSLWRVYVYVEDAEHERILQTRKERKGLHLGQGGEGYIARDSCCYNCGGSGHWGDDCREFYHSEPLIDHTAFSHHWLTQGPFTMSENVPESRPPRDWTSDIPLPGGVENVGRQAKRKEMEKLGRRAQQQEEDDPGEQRERPTGNIPTGPRKTAGSSAKERPTFQFAAASSSKPSLVDRLSDRAPDRESKSRDRDSSRHRHAREREKDRHRERDKDRYRERDKDRGPRYKGGYSS